MDTNIDTGQLESSVEAGVHTLMKNGWEGALKTIFFALILLVVCLIVKAIVLKILDRALDRFKQIEKSLHTFIRSMMNIILWFITLMIVAESLGINASSLLALVSIFGLAVSLSVKDSLANLAGGFTILSTRPFKVGDYVEIGSTGGTIREIGMVYTKLATLDNRIILMPNSVVAPGGPGGDGRLRRAGGAGQADHRRGGGPPRADPQRPRAVHPPAALRGQCAGVCGAGLVRQFRLLDGLPRSAGADQGGV